MPLTPDRAVGDVTRELLEAVGDLVGAVEIDPTPQEVPWSVPLDEDDEHASYDPIRSPPTSTAATQAALVLADFRAPYRGRSTPVNAWWGSFDLAVSLFSGLPAEPPSDDFIMRNSMDSQEVEVGWWPGDATLRQGGLLRLRPPGAARGSRTARSPRRRPAGTPSWACTSSTGTRCGESEDPHAVALGVRPLGLPARLPRLRLGRGARGERRGGPPPVA